MDGAAVRNIDNALNRLGHTGTADAALPKEEGDDIGLNRRLGLDGRSSRCNPGRVRISMSTKGGGRAI